MRFIILAALLGFLSACSPGKVVETILTEQERALVRGAVNDVAKSDGDSLATKLRTDLAPQLRPLMPAMRQALPEPPLELSALHTTATVTGDSRLAEAVYQVRGRDGWALVEASIETAGGPPKLVGFYIEPTPGEPMSMNAFRLGGAGTAGLAMLAAMLAAVLVTIAGVMRIWRSGLFRHRWLWTLGALIGITTLSMNWSTGAVQFQPIAVQILSVSAVKQPVYAPWVLGVSIPVVALIALARRRREAVPAKA
jgi:hypothetical protein